MKRYVMYFKEYESIRSVQVEASDVEQAIVKCKINYHCKMEDIQHIEEVSGSVKEEHQINLL